MNNELHFLETVFQDLVPVKEINQLVFDKIKEVALESKLHTQAQLEI